jgi:uncharacterized YccA/Bax inhibitor family protein
VNGPGRLMSTGAAITLIAIGAILRYAVATTSTHGLNLHAVGVILILAGVLGLLLSLLFTTLGRRRNRPASYSHPPASPPTRTSHQQPAPSPSTKTSRQ